MVVVYTHSSYSDVLDIFGKQAEKFNLKYSVISNAENADIIYSEDLSYSQRLLSSLSQVKDDIILFLHEDMFLYKQFDQDRVDYYSNYLSENPLSFIRLAKTGACNTWHREPTLQQIINPSFDFFAVQPTLWKIQDFIKFLEAAGDKTIWDLERHGAEINSKLGLNGAIHYEGEPRRGGHYDSNIFPYVATAIVKGKWNISEYPELVEILNEYGADISLRGAV